MPVQFKAITRSLFLLILVICAACDRKHDVPVVSRDHWINPTNAFALFAQSSTTTIPAEVTEIQAFGAVWMDMNVCCRFRATEPVIDSIIRGYSKTNWNSVSNVFSRNQYTESFTPPWNPDLISRKDCYVRRVNRGEHMDDFLYLAVDRKSDCVYAVGESETH